jgi:hypothetical protein
MAEHCALSWQAFYSGNSALVRTMIPALLTHLNDHWLTVTERGASIQMATLTRGYQLAAVVLRDLGDSKTGLLPGDDVPLQLALTAATRAVESALAMPQTTSMQRAEAVNEQAAAFFRRGRIYNELARIASDQTRRALYAEAAVRDAEFAIHLAARCRDVLHGVVILEGAKIMARSGVAVEQFYPLFARAEHLAPHQVSAERDESGTSLSGFSVLHSRAEAVLQAVFQGTPVESLQLQTALRFVEEGMRNVPLGHDRWRVKLIPTRVGLLAALGRHDKAYDAALDGLPLVRAIKSPSTIIQLRKSIALLPVSYTPRNKLFTAVASMESGE